jgi:hypothetical protein
MTYIFVGSSESQILRIAEGQVVGSDVLSEYGQSIDLDGAAALNAIAGGASLVPAEQFEEGNPEAMRKLAAELIYTVRETGEMPEAKIQSGKEVIHGNRE